MGDSSIELCGGTHVRTHRADRLFRFLAQGGVAAGVRRIEAVTGPEAYAHGRGARRRGWRRRRTTLKAQPEHLQRKLEQLLEERDKLEARVDGAAQGRRRRASQGTTLDIDGVAVTVADTPREDRDEIAAVADTFRERAARARCSCCSAPRASGAIHVAVTDDLVSRAARRATWSTGSRR